MGTQVRCRKTKLITLTGSRETVTAATKEPHGGRSQGTHTVQQVGSQEW